ncbi:alpha/beta fold hydrolase [Aquiflexum gelatinilyticum]|uniref:alpha/beta fold hydrolase n=1 Tax=Aquiflexum gelatinilyticum TaxID=2961943 RepID=UPI0021676F45|nr:alpha/beta hydrolase [Aquiflexum gelatinilyticum]MCS4433469.1 alpha/beta hydrolase [Aquiflexum gelatinilyticum]
MNIKKVTRIAGKYLLIFFGGLITLFLLALLFLHLQSPGKANPFVDENGEIISKSISTIERIELGGIGQYLIIGGIDSTKPVLLFLHGGPGSPELAHVKKFNPYLEHDFVVVHWEQRGSGKSYNKNISVESMTVDQLISDTKDLSEYLINRFNKDKIYLMGHSWGSYLGIKTIEKHPELFHCFIGIGQVADQYRSERISYEWVKYQAEKKEDKKAIKELGALDFPDINASSEEWIKFLMAERSYVDKFGGGVFRDYQGSLYMLLPVINAKEYTLHDKMNYGLGALFSLDHLWDDIITDNLFETIDSVQIPVYFFQGVFDYQTSYIVAKEFYDQLEAPEKQFFTFENSAHCPIFDEPERFNNILREIVRKE